MATRLCGSALLFTAKIFEHDIAFLLVQIMFRSDFQVKFEIWAIKLAICIVSDFAKLDQKITGSSTFDLDCGTQTAG